MYIAELLFFKQIQKGIMYTVYILHLSFYFIQPNFARGIYEVLNYQICEYVLRFNSFYDEINQKGKICGTKYQ